jgi:hypothetical protein
VLVVVVQSTKHIIGEFAGKIDGHPIDVFTAAQACM